MSNKEKALNLLARKYKWWGYNPWKGKFSKIGRDELRSGINPDKPTLLLIHGTNGTLKKAFKGYYTHDEFEPIRAKYGSQIFAFAHPSLTDSIKENATRLYEDIGAIGFGELDMVARSRGALVGRFLLEKTDFLKESGAAKNTVNRYVMLASPNEGTPSASAQLSILNRTRTINSDLIAGFPFEPLGPNENEIEVTAQMLDYPHADKLALVRGATDMDPNSETIRYLNQSLPREDTSTRYYGIAGQINLSKKAWGEKTEVELGMLDKKLKEIFPNPFHDGINPLLPALGKMSDPSMSLDYESYYEIKETQRAHHINYMEIPEVRRAITHFLTTQDRYMGAELEKLP